MKNVFALSRKLVFICIFVLLIACGKNSETTVNQYKIDPKVKGGIPNRIVFTAVNDKESALRSIDKGDADIFLGHISKQRIKNREFENYETYSEVWSLLLNPAPNAAPYQVKTKEKIEFNPFAITELRYALNSLINRKFIAEEILKNGAQVNLSPIISGTANSWRFDLQAKRLDITENGNKSLAMKTINDALERAAHLVENEGKLEKVDGIWHFMGEAITIKFVIDSGDSQEKLEFANYFSKLMEECGFKVEKLLKNSEASKQFVYSSNPIDLAWNVYTESIKDDTASPYKEENVIKNMSSISGFQPGWGQIGWWNYKNAQADELAGNLAMGKIHTIDDYWNTILKINEIGLKEAVRIYVVSREENVVTRKKSFYERLFYGIDVGINSTSLENASTKSGILRVLQLSEDGILFNSLWNPLSTSGFSDANTKNLMSLIFDKEFSQSPFGQISERRSSVISSKLNPTFQTNSVGNTDVSGKILIAKDALVFDENALLYKQINQNAKAAVETTYKINFGVWHHGRNIGPNDYIYAEAQFTQWNRVPYKKLELQSKVASKWNSDNTLTIWSNKFLPLGGLENIGNFPSLKINNSYSVYLSLPWEIVEGVKALIEENISKDKTFIENIDLKNPIFIESLKIKLSELADKGFVPNILSGKVSPTEAKENYDLAIKFIDNYGHPLIGNGPYILAKLDTQTGYAELKAFRNPNYTEIRGKWAELYRDIRMSIDKIEQPKKIITGNRVEIIVRASQIDYPRDNKRDTRSGEIIALFKNKNNEEFTFKSTNVGEGKFLIVIDEETSKGMHGLFDVVYRGSINGKYTTEKMGTILFNEN